jgi:hypothetical protein
MRVTTTHSQPTKQIRNELTEFCAKKETIQTNQCHVIDSGHRQPELSTEFVEQFEYALHASNSNQNNRRR